MPIEKHLVLCGGLDLGKKRTPLRPLPLRLGKEEGKGQIHLDVDAITEKMVANLPSVLHDLLEVATYVYVADQATSRGGTRSFDYGYGWHRDFVFRIPVRKHEVWSSQEIREALEEALSVASGDTYSFEFVAQSPELFQEFLTFGTETEPAYRKYDEVVLFSGGIDSATGAIEEVVKNERLPLLVSHQSNNKHIGLQRALHDYIRAICPNRPEPLHVPVKINKDKRLTKDTTQRSRSFVYASLGAIVAHMFQLKRARFYENGIVSCNLMWDNQTLQARATRSTHPHVLNLFSKLVSSLLEVDFVFENPYFGKTKTEVCERLKELHHQVCIESTRSCADSTYQNPHNHCGTCSQCIDRRFATLASECQKHDPDTLYKVNVFTDALPTTQDRTMALGFIGFAQKIESMSREGFVQACSSEVHQIARHMGTEATEVGLSALYLLHRRHAERALGVMGRQIAENCMPLVRVNLPDTCLVSMVGEKLHLLDGKRGETSSRGRKKHAKGDLNSRVGSLLQLHRGWSAGRIADAIREATGQETSADAVRHTDAWKNRQRDT
jgi:hypothetical protein